MFSYSLRSGKMLLSDYEADFWTEYKNNHVRYDRLFYRMFASFRYFLQDESQSIEVITDNFIDDVYVHLMCNSKKYSELYRVNVVNPESYSITDNYSVVENMSRNKNSNDTNVFGARTDSTDENIGSRTDSTADTIGSQSSEEVTTKAGFNSSGFENDTKNNMSQTGRADSSTTTMGKQDNMTTYNKGEQSDTHNNTESENYELTKKGNIGVQTSSEVMMKHKDFWSVWEFYEMIFKDISKELLMVGD